MAEAAGDELGERQGIAELVADCAADALRLSSLICAPTDPLRALALPIVARHALEACLVRVARLAPGSPVLASALDLLSAGPDVLVLTEELGRRVLDGETLAL